MMDWSPIENLISNMFNNSLVWVIGVLILLVIAHIIYLLNLIHSNGKNQSNSLPGGHIFGKECWCMNSGNKFNKDTMSAYGYEVIEGEMTSKEEAFKEKHEEVIKNLEKRRKEDEKERETADGERVDLDELKEKRQHMGEMGGESTYHVNLHEVIEANDLLSLE